MPEMTVHERKLKDVRDAGLEALLAASEYVPVVLDTAFENGPCRFLLVASAGTATLVQPDGTVRAGVPLVAGRNDVSCKQVNTGGTATGLFACY